MSMCLDPLSPSHLCGTYKGFMSSQRKTERDPEVYPASLISPSWHWGAVGRPRVGRLVEDNRREDHKVHSVHLSPHSFPAIHPSVHQALPSTTEEPLTLSMRSWSGVGRTPRDGTMWTATVRHREMVRAAARVWLLPCSAAGSWSSAPAPSSSFITLHVDCSRCSQPD